MQNVCVLFTYILIVGEGNRRWCQHNFINMGSCKRNSRAPLCLSGKQQEYPGGERQEDDGDDEEQDHHQQDQAQSHSQQ